MDIWKVLSGNLKAIAGALIGAVFLTAQPAQAQFGEAAGIAESMQQDYLSRDLILFEQGLNLDDTQRVIVEAMFHDYEAAFEDGLDEMRDEYNEMRPHLQTADEKRMLRMVFSPIESWGKRKALLGEEFLENVKVVLTKEQLDQWPNFQRQFFREKQLPRGQLSGESLNLFYAVRDMELDPQLRDQLQQVMDAYDLALDKALHDRKKAMTDTRSEMLQSLAEQDSDLGLRVYKKQLKARVGVRQVNDEFITHISSALPPEIGTKFRYVALERAYPRVFRDTPVQRLFERAKELEDLGPTVPQAIADLESSYLNELRPMNEQLLSVMREYEPKEAEITAKAFAHRVSGKNFQKGEDPTRALFLERDEMSRRYARQLKSVLTPEQFSKLPGGYRWAADTNENARQNQQLRTSGSQRRTPGGVRPTINGEEVPDE